MTALSLYVHVPFCASRCGYCDFNTYTAKELGSGVDQENFHEFLIREIKIASEHLGDRPVDSVFIGGGTPTLIGASALNLVLESIGNSFNLAPNIEITTEANPDSVDALMLEQLRAGGFTRISLGMQSAASNVLKVLQRTHTPGASVSAAKLARAAGFDHVNLDLIYGTPGESDQDVRDSVSAVIDAGVDHVSAYSLIVEQGTPLARQVARGELPAPDDDICADRYEIIDTMLGAAGFDWYEVSNWARPGGECTHNQAYWLNSDWWGIGPGAHGHVGGTRWWNHKHPSTYAAALESGSSLRAGEETLTLEQAHTEMIMLGLRTRAGLTADCLTGSESERVPGLIGRGILDSSAWDAGVVRVTPRGRLLADLAVRELLG